MAYPYFVTDLINVVAEYEKEQQALSAQNAESGVHKPSLAEQIVQRLSQWTTPAKPAMLNAECIQTCAEPSRG